VGGELNPLISRSEKVRKIIVTKCIHIQMFLQIVVTINTRCIPGYTVFLYPVIRGFNVN
jgi:hypothetical protein